MSSSTRPDRPNRLVMGLGIATIVLFSLNLLAMLSQRVWPKLQDLEFFNSESAVEEVAPLVELHGESHVGHTLFTYVTKKRGRRCREHRRHHSIFSYDFSHDGSSGVSFDFSFDGDSEFSLDSDLDRLEREIEREMGRLELDLSDAQSDVDEAVTLKLHIDEPKAILLQLRKTSLADLEKKVAMVTRTFEIRVKQHEEAARMAKQIKRKR
ncbi:MAG: hypothetical protein E2O85_02865 [Bacteroidetes bacterium]|nr:MAG: hypothetical protein E2O85_02865 [Bacteroidota bacterium]